jgi:SM-20-related protein
LISPLFVLPAGGKVLISARKEQMAKPNSDSPLDLHLARDFFDAETCRDLIREMQRSPASPAVTYGQDKAGSINDRVRKVTRLLLSPETVANITRRLMDYREEIGAHFGVNLSACEDPQFLCYRVGDFFVAHQDGNTGLLRLDTDQSRRVSISIFLNQQSDEPEAGAYGGGSLVFSDWRHNRELQLKGEAGTLVAFRSETTHEVIPVTHGERYSIVSWYR